MAILDLYIYFRYVKMMTKNIASKNDLALVCKFDLQAFVLYLGHGFLKKAVSRPTLYSA